MLATRNIHAGYGRVSVLRDVSVSVPAGKVVALLGPNGAGKTTLLRVLGGLLAPSHGAVLLDDTEVTGWRAYRRARAGVTLLPEGRAIFPRLTVRENLAMFCSGRRVEVAVAAATEMFPRLGPRLNQQAGTMSGGEQQMLAFSRAIVRSSKIVLADELSMGLAPVIIDEIYAAVERLRGEGYSLLLVEQYADRALALADEVALMHKGRVVASGPPSEFAGVGAFDHYLGGGAS